MQQGQCHSVSLSEARHFWIYKQKCGKGCEENKMRHSLIILLLGLNKPRMYICYANFLQTNIQQIYIIKYQKYLQHIKLIPTINIKKILTQCHFNSLGTVNE